MADLLGALIAFLLTLAVLSYLLGDNPMYRLAIHIFVGAAAGYAAVIAYFNVIQPQVVLPLSSLENLLSFNFAVIGPPAVAALLSVLLLIKSRPALGRLGSLATAFMVGVGTAVAIGGAVTGTLFPQTTATFVSLLPRTPLGGLDLEKTVEAIVIVTGTVATLGFFYYGARGEPGGPVQRPLIVRPIARLGQVFMGAAFGVMYAGALAASLAVFAERASDVRNLIQLLLRTP